MANHTSRYDSHDVALWPLYPEEDPGRVLGGPPPRGWLADKAWGSITTNRTIVDRREPGAGSEPRPRRRIKIRCAPSMHNGKSPTLAEVWSTPYGLLYAARVKGRAGDPPVDPEDPLAPPTAVLPELDRGRRVSRLGRTNLASRSWDPVPMVGIRVLLPCTSPERLFVKCDRCGPVELDPDKVMQQALFADQQARQDDDGTALSITVVDVAIV